MQPFVILTARRLMQCTTSVLLGMSLAFIVTMTVTAVRADTYPSKPVRIIVPYGPGGIADVTMRLVAQDLSKRFGQQFFIENRPGAGGVVGMQSAREAPADGYTLVMVGGGLTIAKALFKSLPYNIETDFIPISTTASYGLVITTKAGSPYQTIKDVIANAKAHPGTLNFGTINAGSAQNLSAELFRTMAELDVTIVPYKTTPDLANAVLRGDVDVAFEYFVGFQSPITSSQMIVLATTARERASNLPNVPTVIESGLAGYEVTSWNGLAVPKGTPADVVTELNRAVDEALKSPEIQKFSNAAGMDARGMSSDDLHRRIKSDVVKWSRVIEKAGIKKR
ncbi:MAG TPA: tripartite tricarboxylate transporter substrate binding protein [Pseudolabrys sp.]|nr:tripartite tricarboxylate transporter substrate binding protein [Pseudolabrys sp.]